IMLAAGIGHDRIVHVAQLSPDPDGDSAVTPGEERVLDGLPPRFLAYVGRLSTEKGVHVLLEAMQSHPGIPLVIVGDGPQADDLRARSASMALVNVTFAGRLGRGAVERVLERCTALVVPSVWAENAPMVVFEAARAGTPVIASRSGGLGELLDRMAGRAVPAGDAVALADAIHHAWRADDARMREQVRIAWARHGAAHATRAHLEAVEAVYRRVMAPAKAAA
ncbi:MAG TPA: glycosyltransferase, partial [Candidatus Krumholzibacteria bacterium]